jgi:predicted CxxxxCH...CXXCH cytochrome family protein
VGNGKLVVGIAVALVALCLAGCLSVRDKGDGVGSGQCGTCHPSQGDGATHAAHAMGGTYGKPVPCTTCHEVPTTAAATATHRNGKADVRFAKKSLATTGGLEPSWDGTRCKNVYCHGESLSGGADTSPAWGAYEKNGLPCKACHGSPPPDNHPDSTGCKACHADSFSGDKLNLEYHLDGVVEAGGEACNGCHPSNGGGAAHEAHLGGSVYAKAIACGDCHVVPASSEPTATHRNGQVDVIFAPGGLASKGGLEPVWDGTRCADVYCHGASLSGGTDTAPAWGDYPDGLPCTACHGRPPEDGHVARTDCEACHSATFDGTTLNLDHHIDGTVETSGESCSTCHDANGGGASHDAHRVAGTYGKPVACGICHEVPSTPAQSGKHRNGTVDVIFKAGSLATTGGVSPSWNGATCSKVYCHGATLNGGEDTSPTWDASLAGLPCKACHGHPPGGGHEQETNCAGCHASTISGSGVSLTYHMDGKIEATDDKMTGSAP